MDRDYERLILDNTLYAPDFVAKFGSSGTHWTCSSNAQRERSLCHDAICVLLCNLEPSDDIGRIYKRKIEAIRMPTKRFKAADPVEEETGDCDSDFGVDESQSDESDHEDNELDPVDGFAYFCLEGSASAGAIQMDFASKLGIVPSRMYDIIAYDSKQLIEVKVTTDPDRYIDNLYHHIDVGEHYGLIIVDINLENVTYHGIAQPLPGEIKALNWLALRKMRMREFNIQDTYHEDLTSDQVIYNEGRGNVVAQAMIDMVEVYRNDGLMAPPLGTYELEMIDIKEVFEGLMDPTATLEGPTVVYKGKITPMNYCDPIILEDETDQEAVDYFLLGIRDTASRVIGKSSLWEAVKKMDTLWQNREEGMKQFGFINVDAEAKEIMGEETIKLLGIGRKQRTHMPGVEGARQEEHDPIVLHKYSKWIEDLYRTMGHLHRYSGHRIDLGSIETKSSIPMHRYIGDQVESVLGWVSTLNVGLFINQIQNFYSRVSGSYNTTIGNKTTHSKIACVPIKAVLHKGSDVLRICSGLAFRGPHHTRNATDKMNFLVVERIDPTKIHNELYDWSKCCRVEFKDGPTLLIRTTSVRKIDGVHLTFLNNSLFMALNTIGEMLDKTRGATHDERTAQMERVQLLEHQPSRSFFINRVIDGVIMGVLGNARDEGFLAMYRKFLMVIIDARRGSCSFTFDVQGFCKKANECIIDNPFGMMLLLSLKYTLAKM